MQELKTKKINEADLYEPLSPQMYEDLIKEIDRLFDSLKNDLSTVFNLKWEWQQLIIKHGSVMNESYAPVRLCAIVEGNKLINELRYEIRENANTAMKVNKVIELYRDKLKTLVKKNVFRPKTYTPEEIYKQQGDALRNDPEWQQSLKAYQADFSNRFHQSVLERQRKKLEQERQDFEAQKRGTGGAKITTGAESPAPTQNIDTQAAKSVNPVVKKVIRPEYAPFVPEKQVQGTLQTPAPTASIPPQPAPQPPTANPLPVEPKAPPKAAPLNPDETDANYRAKLIKTGQLIYHFMQNNEKKRVTPDDLRAILKKATGTGKLDDVDIDILDDAEKKESIDLAKAYIAIHGNNSLDEPEESKDSSESTPEVEKTVEELMLLSRKELIEYLEKVTSKEAVEEAKKEFKGSIPNVKENRKYFIEKILASRKKTESIGRQLRVHLRNKVRILPILEGTTIQKVEYLKKLLKNQ